MGRLMASGSPLSTRAALLRAYGEPPSIERVPLPEPHNEDSLIVEITATTLCGTDVHIWEGHLARLAPVALPMVHGHEMVGRIVRRGRPDAVDALGHPLSIGDRIVWTEPVCGHCEGCSVLAEPVFCVNRRTPFMQRADLSPYVVGGLADYVYVPPGAARLRVPDEVLDPWAAASSCAGKTVVRAFRNADGIPADATVVIQGDGPLGLFATAYARLSGASTVIVIGGTEQRLAIAEAWGADETIHIGRVTDPDERVAQVREMTGGRGAQLVMDFAGAATSNAEGVLMCAARGCYVLVGVPHAPTRPLPPATIMFNEVRVTGSRSGDIRDLRAALAFFHRQRDRVDWNAMFEDPVGLCASGAALAQMAEGTAIKPVVMPALDRTTGRDLPVTTG